jgi:hypothetical protein
MAFFILAIAVLLALLGLFIAYLFSTSRQDPGR